MRIRAFLAKTIAVLATMAAAPAAHAQLATIDVGAIAQLLQQVMTMKDQLQTAKNQLQAAESAYRSMTGGRGMHQLLSNQPRNYLPEYWEQLEAAMRQSLGGFGAFQSQMNSLMSSNAVLTSAQLALLSPAERAQVEAGRRSAALLQATMREALHRTSSRFEAIQQLVGAISSAGDQKAILDLQARISAEETMLQNEQTKLQVLYQATQAEELARLQRSREQALAGVGSLRGLPPMGL
jgi:type IV secretion system protein VirB5